MLRTRLMLGLLLLLIILFSMGLYSINRWSDLGRRIEALNREDDSACQAVENLKHAGAAMNTVLLRRLAGDSASTPVEYGKASADFSRAQQTLEGLPLDHEEKSALKAVEKNFKRYQKAALSIVAAPASTNTLSAATDLGKATTELALRVDDLTMAHRRAMDIGAHGPAGAIAEMKRFVGFLMVLALAATILAWMGLNRGLLEPLRTLTSSIQQVGAGTLQQEIPVPDNHELGMLALSFNRMATQVREYRASASGELSRLNMTIRATLASFPDPIFVLNSEGSVEFRNPEADQLAMQLLFSGVTRLPEKVDEKVEDVRRTGKDYLPTLFQEAIKFHLNGQDRYFLPRIVLLRNEKKETFGVAVILEDVTRMLLLDDVKSNLIATVSHELKTPLTSVRMVIYLLHERTVGELNAKQADLILTAREDADRLLRTLNDLLDLAKLEQGPTSLALVPATAEEIIQASVQETREAAHAAGIKVGVEIAPDLPGVEIDRQRIAYVLANLLTNAIKYAPAGSAVGVRGEKGTMREGGPGVRISVKDQGPGIRPEHQEHIFERFYRVPGTQKKGAGLGLSIAREITVAHHGEIGVISLPGAGCEFFFLLPISLQAQAKGQSQFAIQPDAAQSFV